MEGEDGILPRNAKGGRFSESFIEETFEPGLKVLWVNKNVSSLSLGACLDWFKV